jgi:hypothetical protein
MSVVPPTSHLATTPLPLEYLCTKAKYTRVPFDDPGRVRNGSAKREGQIEGLRRSVQTARYTNTVLVEVYRSDSAPAEHKKTAHCQTWRDTVAEMMAEPRSSVNTATSSPTKKVGDRTSPLKRT